MGRRVSIHDRPGDLAFAGPGGAAAPATIPIAPALEKRERRPWARRKPPTDGREAHRWLRQIEAGYAPGEVFYHPGYGSNVAWRGDRIMVVEHGPLDEDAWFKAGCDGPAPRKDSE